MKKRMCLVILSVALCMTLNFAGCGNGNGGGGGEITVDENTPLSEIKAKVEAMDLDQLRSQALAYKDAILGKEGEFAKITDQFKEIPLTEALGEEAQKLKGDLDNLTKSIEALKERFQVYYDKLKEKGGDVSDLDIL